MEACGRACKKNGYPRSHLINSTSLPGTMQLLPVPTRAYSYRGSVGIPQTCTSEFGSQLGEG